MDQYQLIQLLSGIGSVGQMSGNPVGLAVGTGLQAGLGLYQTLQANKRIKELEKTPRPTFNTGIARREYENAQNLAKRGFSAEELAVAKGNINRAQNFSYRRGLDLAGGNMSSALGSTLSSSRLNALNDLAARDAQLRRSNIRDARGAGYALQGQENLQTNADLNYRNMLEQGYGRAKAQGLQNITNAGMRFAHYYPFGDDKNTTPKAPNMNVNPAVGLYGIDGQDGYTSFFPQNRGLPMGGQFTSGYSVPEQQFNNSVEFSNSLPNSQYMYGLGSIPSYGMPNKRGLLSGY